MKHIGFLAVLFVALLTAVIVKEASRPEAGSLSHQLPQQRLSAKPFKVEDVVRVVVSGPADAEPFTLVRTSAGDVATWTVVEPFAAPAAAGVIDRLLTAVSEARGELRLEDAAALAKFDLSDRRATRVTFEDEAGGVLVEFALGKSSGQRGAFVRPLFEGVRDGAYAVTEDLRGVLGLTKTRPGDMVPQVPRAAHFHDLAMPPFAMQGALRVELTTPHWTVAFEKRAADWLPVEGAPDAPLQSQGLKQLIGQLGGATSGTELVDPATASALGLDAPSYRVTVVGADGTRRVAVGVADRDADTYYMRLDVEEQTPAVYALTRYAFERLFPRGGSLFEFTPLGADDLTRLEVQRVGGDVAITRPGPNDDWTIETPSWLLPPDSTQLRGLGASLRGVRAIDWYAGPVTFVAETTVSYGEKGTEADALNVMQIGQDAPGGNGKLARLPGSDAIVVLATSAVDRLQPDPLTLFRGQPLDGVTANDITSVLVRKIAVEDGAKSEWFQLSKSDDGWVLTDDTAGHPGAQIPIELWLSSVIDIEVSARSDYVGPFSMEIEVHREGAEPVVVGIGAIGEAGGESTALRLGDVTFLASVAEAVADVDPESLRKKAEAAPPEADDEGDDTDDTK